ncbi:MAG: glycosyltransferase family 39 protein [Planctomycetia bacterium]|nr:glycosyltransferase family 39 protein [Planctomycetia bacterium]
MATSDIENARRAPLWREAEFCLLALIVAGIYFTRVTALPLVGEESRWACGAAEMLRTGDWIVPRQQGEIFADRPPGASWAMALVGLVRGRVDEWAVRLPSIVATLLTSLLIYGYARHFLAPLGSLAAGLAFATSVQVLQLGRLGECEALFTLFVSASLLVWHAGYVRAWRPVAIWSAGYALAALATLVKGPQAPVYFVSVTCVFLLVERKWRWIVSWPPHLAGIAVFVAILAAWQVPYFLMTNWDAVLETWTGQAGRRFGLEKLLPHLVSYPLETLGCLLPWSLFLAALVLRPVREAWRAARPMTRFLIAAIAVTYPTVWLALEARGRYYMPLYPLVAVLLAWIVERCATAEAGSRLRGVWNTFLVVAGAAAILGGVAIAGATWVGPLAGVRQSAAWTAALVALCVIGGTALFWCRRKGGASAARLGLVATSAVVGLAYTGAVVNIDAARLNAVEPAVAEVRSHFPAGVHIASFGAVNHRFAYYYGEPIPRRDWPRTIGDVPSGLVYFCFSRTPGDNVVVRGRVVRYMPSSFPFAWEQVAAVSCERKKTSQPVEIVVIGRIVEPRVARATSTDPQFLPKTR